MKIFKSEFINEYSTYTFSFAEYAVLESADDIPQIYSGGYLPYTGDLEINYPIFYLARSLRVNLERFKDSSENRRVDRKLEHLAPEIKRYSLSTFDYKDESFIDFCLSYANERFSGNSMSKERFNYIMESKIATDILEFRNSKTNELLGYVLAVIKDNTFHYWFSFFNTQYIQDIPLGKWMMWKMISWSKENGLDYTYLGTSYGKKSLYKIRDFKGLEFFNGNTWDDNIKTLKSLCKQDDITKEKDLFKSSSTKNDFIHQLVKEN